MIKWKSPVPKVSSEDLLMHCHHMVAQLHASSHCPAPSPSIVELTVLINEYHVALETYMASSTRVNWIMFHEVKERMKAMLHYCKRHLKTKEQTS